MPHQGDRVWKYLERTQTEEEQTVIDHIAEKLRRETGG
jgi:hypothetical protein